MAFWSLLLLCKWKYRKNPNKSTEWYSTFLKYFDLIKYKNNNCGNNYFHQSSNSLGQKNKTQLLIYVVQPLIIRDESYTQCVTRTRQIVPYANVSSYHCRVFAGKNFYTFLFLPMHRPMTLPAPYIVSTKLCVCSHVLTINKSFLFLLFI